MLKRFLVIYILICVLVAYLSETAETEYEELNPSYTDEGILLREK